MKRFSLNSIQWDYNWAQTGFVGGRLPLNNLSRGYHGILKQWWDHYLKIELPKVLLISENNRTKKELNDFYKNWDIHTLDLYPELDNDKSDIIMDICDCELINKYDLVINQATLEHLYNPFGAMQNMCESLNKGGYLISHTHSQLMGYHQYPRDYMRFMIDWWYDLPQHIRDIKLIELYEDDKLIHIFTCYEKGGER